MCRIYPHDLEDCVALQSLFSEAFGVILQLRQLSRKSRKEDCCFEVTSSPTWFRQYYMVLDLSESSGSDRTFPRQLPQSVESAVGKVNIAVDQTISSAQVPSF
jgi:hypothetical protein